LVRKTHINSEHLPKDSRRDFVKKSLVSTLIVAQPTILTGILRAQGGGGSTIASTNWDVQGSITVNGSTPSLTSYAANATEPARHYGESSAVDVGNGYSCKAKVWATPSLHSGTVSLQVSGEIFHTADGANSATTDRITLTGTIYNYATGELNAPSPNPLSVGAVSPPNEINYEETYSSGGTKLVYKYWVSLIPEIRHP
jgi:hypothetical protein